MKSFILTIMCAVVLGTTAMTSFTSCSTTGGVTGVVTDVNAWLTDPKNAALIQEIAQAAQLLIGMFGGERTATPTAKQATVVTGKLCPKYPTVPAGAIAEIAKDPAKYIKK